MSSDSDRPVDLLEEALGSRARSSKPVSRSHPFAKKDVPSLAKYIESDACRQIYLMLGVSTSAGIPDFRSPETGACAANLARLKLPHPEAVFDIQFFRRNPNPFYTLAKELYPGKFRPTLTHSFIKLLSDKGLLGLCLTQNIDTLERRAGIPADKIIEAHGSFATQRCIECKRPFDDTEMKKIVEEERIPRCKTCKGLVKPDIVFFGESLPPNFYGALAKLRDADLLIVMGTSLTVHPFASLINTVSGKCPRVLINLDQVGGIGSERNDLVFLGKCDDIVRDLARGLGWEDELDKEWEETAKSLDNHETPHEPPEKDKVDEAKEKLEHELEKITKNVGSALSLIEKDGAGVEQTEARSGTGSGTSNDVEVRRETIPELPKIPQTGEEEGERDPEKNE
ncbi:Sir2 family histone deacetylase Hst2 [Lactarius akahatsu]|uniref:Sir2 family histone deacetylase Hst2 n=1 Tax=Lactarius akahatsu TaxID=416441 RepID=A0AAD4LAY3_9AGAM|nr:Sir2 family histone deacetylase Hst2 [Lactarius akahatsu]